MLLHQGEVAAKLSSIMGRKDFVDWMPTAGHTPRSTPSTPIVAKDDAAFPLFAHIDSADSKEWGAALWSNCDVDDALGEKPVVGSPSTPLFMTTPQDAQRRRQLRVAGKGGSRQRRRRPHSRASPPPGDVSPPCRPTPLALSPPPVPQLPDVVSWEERCIWEEVNSCLQAGGTVDLASDGEGAAYFCCNAQGVPIAVFKPYDEEPGAVRNPRGGSAPMLGGIPPGGGWLREVAAYRLDHEQFAGVPETTAVCLPSSLGFFPDDKFGSLQRFVRPAEGCAVTAANDVLPSAFLPEDVHRIGLLDLRLGNCDRHGGNLLAMVPSRRDKTHSVRLVPIDHGYVLPLNFEHLDFEWLWYPQAAQPFSPATMAYVAALRPEEDVRVLRDLALDEAACNMLYAATAVLQDGCVAGLTLRELAELIRR
eukprot:EG_transcript_14082